MQEIIRIFAHVFCLTECGATGAAIAQASTLRGIERIDPYCAFRLRLHSQTYRLCTRRNRAHETVLLRFGFAEKSHQDPLISGLAVSVFEPGRWLRVFPSLSNLPQKNRMQTYFIVISHILSSNITAQSPEFQLTILSLTTPFYSLLFLRASTKIL